MVETMTMINIKPYEEKFISLIRDRLGLVISHQKPELYKTITEACKKFKCQPEDYLEMLTSCSQDSLLLDHLIIGITIGETYFFRDKNQMAILKDYVLPKLILRKREEGNLSLRIWSAGCSSGEEIYTMAMLLTEHLPDINQWTLNLLGTDINTKLLQKAIAGKYSEWSMRSISNDYKQRFFTHTDNLYVLPDELRERVNFDFLNLNDNCYPSIINGTNAQDLILCRNVLIYFDAEHVLQLMQKLSASLAPRGYLLLGASDPSSISHTNLTACVGKSGLFVLEPPDNQTVIPKADPVKSTVILPVAKTPVVKPSVKKTLDHHTRQSHTVLAGTAETYLKSVNDFLQNANWQSVLNVIDEYEITHKPSVTVLNAKAIALANLGKLEQSIMASENSLAIDAMNHSTYFIYALTLAELNRLNDAENALRKSLFINRQFVVAHLQLGLLLLKQKKASEGIKCLRNALKIALSENPQTLVPESQGMHFGRLVEILKTEIDLYQG